MIYLDHSRKKCNIAKIYSKNPHLHQLFTVTNKPINSSPNDIVSGNFDSKKVDQNEVF